MAGTIDMTDHETTDRGMQGVGRRRDDNGHESESGRRIVGKVRTVDMVEGRTAPQRPHHEHRRTGTPKLASSRKKWLSKRI